MSIDMKSFSHYADYLKKFTKQKTRSFEIFKIDCRVYTPNKGVY